MAPQPPCAGSELEDEEDEGGEDAGGDAHARGGSESPAVVETAEDDALADVAAEGAAADGGEGPQALEQPFVAEEPGEAGEDEEDVGFVPPPGEEAAPGVGGEFAGDAAEGEGEQGGEGDARQFSCLRGFEEAGATGDHAEKEHGHDAPEPPAVEHVEGAVAEAVGEVPDGDVGPRGAEKVGGGGESPGVGPAGAGVEDGAGLAGGGGPAVGRVGEEDGGEGEDDAAARFPEEDGQEAEQGEDEEDVPSVEGAVQEAEAGQERESPAEAGAEVDPPRGGVLHLQEEAQAEEEGEGHEGLGDEEPFVGPVAEGVKGAGRGGGGGVVDVVAVDEEDAQQGHGADGVDAVDAVGHRGRRRRQRAMTRQASSRAQASSSRMRSRRPW